MLVAHVQSAAGVPAAFDTLAVAIALLGPDGRISGVNRTFTDLFGWASDELAGLDLGHISVEAHSDGLLPTMLRTRDGQSRDVQIAPCADGDRTTLVVHDVTESHRAAREAEVRKETEATDRQRTEEQLRKLSRAVEQSSSVIVITDANACIEYVNPRFTAVTGYSAAEALGQNPRVLQSGETAPEIYRQMWSTLALGKEWRGDFTNRRKNGERFIEHAIISPIFDEHGQLTHYLAVKDDVTERRDLEGRLRQSQKLEALGLLAGGVAHDFNNLLLIITGYCDYLLEEVVDDPFLEALNEIGGAARRAGDLTRQLLAFSRRQASTPRLVDLTEVVSATLKMLRRLLREDIVVEHDLSRCPLGVFADPAMLEQVVLNLVLNARDAMAEGGTLRIEAEVAEFPHKSPRCGSWAVLRVSDSGCGIPADLVPRIFEPFVTTKKSGKGTGLGLATVYGIVEQHQGWIEVDSEPGRGSVFRVFLPLLEKEAEAAGRGVPGVEPGKGERILLVEDEGAVRDLLRLMLVRLGYEVVTAADGSEALSTWSREEGRFDMLVTDVVMPGGLSGQELGRRLRGERPALPVLYLSGYRPEALGMSAQDGVAFISKPCSSTQLGQRIRALMALRV